MDLSHGVSPVNELATHWHWHVPVLLTLTAALLLYLVGVASMSAGPLGPHERWRVGIFVLGLTVLGAALMSPIDSLAPSLFYVHMIQHLLLMLVASPLLVLGKPAVAYRAALVTRLAKSERLLDSLVWRGTMRIALNLGVVGIANTVVIWAWHLPNLYEAAIRNDLVHALEHGGFVAVSLPFWAVVLQGTKTRGPAGRIFLVFGVALQSSALGAIIAFAGSPLYSLEVLGTPAWGLTPMEDQQLAGALMWVLPGILYLATMVGVLFVWFKRMEALSPTPSPARDT
ncbi:MAG: cytochrome c oxidase assembly protein [Actinomycetota bacterium]|nr:cytochrome c oxidase assembly protein [Actinomycetota bacterium]